MSNKFRIFCVLIMLAVSIVPAFGQSTANPANNQPVTNSAAPDSAKTSLSQSELSSAALAPCVVFPAIGTFSNPDDESKRVMSSTNTTLAAGVNWASWGTCQPTTCTWTISSVPPGPMKMYLANAATPFTPVTTPVMIDSTTGVISQDGYYDDWFDRALVVGQNLIIVIAADGAWIQSGDPGTHVSPYPTLQWGPFNVTLVYQ